MNELPAKARSSEITKVEKATLQSIAHGAEGFGNEYGSGPSAANADARTNVPVSVVGDSASPAASAMATRHARIPKSDVRRGKVRSKKVL